MMTRRIASGIASLMCCSYLSADLIDPFSDKVSPAEPEERKTIRSADGIQGRDQRTIKGSKKPYTGAVAIAEPASNLPIKVQGHNLTGSREDGVVTIEKNVLVTRGNLEIRSNSAKIYYDRENKAVIRVLATGRVRLLKNHSESSEIVKARGEVVEYLAKEEKITLKGGAEIDRGDDRIRGSVIDYYVKTGKIKASGVEGVVTP